MKVWALLVLLACGCGAQENASEREDRDLNTALAEAGSSPVDFIRALEKHLSKYPDSPRKAEFERALVKAAIENKDERRTVLYGERVLARDPDDIQVLEKVIRALLDGEGKENAARALQYAGKYVALVEQIRKEKLPESGAARWQDEVDRGYSRALVLQARATGISGDPVTAASLARRAYAAYATAEAAREVGRWLAASGNEEEAVAFYADAFSLSDSRNSDAERALDRARMGELYRKVHGSEKGLGEIVLQAYDRTTAAAAERKLRLNQADPNAQVSRVMDFTISQVNGGKLALSSLRGKTVVFDFWATWCGPCRIQHPLYDEVKKKFTQQGDVVFLSINTDEEKDLVAPFVREMKWNPPIYFDDGLARRLKIDSIPTTVIVDKNGEIASRMNGFVPDRFVEALAERIREVMK
jgi:thiol-disulfide isomerase/thioredoxin